VTWRIEAHTLAVAETPGPEVFFQRAFGDWVEIAIHVFVLRSGDRTIVVDTGLIDGFEVLNERMRARKGARAGFRRLAGLEDVLDRSPDAVVLTSFGPYAAGGLPHLGEDVPVYVSSRGLDNLARSEEPALIHALPNDVLRRLSISGPVRDERTIFDGIRFVETGVHHPASAAVVVDTEDGPVAIADPVFVRANLVEGIALGAAEHAAGWFALVRRLAAACRGMIAIHDPDPVPVPVAAWHPSLRPQGEISAAC